MRTLLALLCLTLLCGCEQRINRITDKLAPTAVVETPKTLWLEEPEVVVGTTILLTGISTSGQCYGFATREQLCGLVNLIAYDGVSGKSKMVFAKDVQQITKFAQISATGIDLHRTVKFEKEKPADTIALYFEFVTRDSNGDGKITREDLRNVALSSPFPDSLKILLEDVEVRDLIQLGNNVIVLTTQNKAKVVELVSIDVKKQSIISRATLGQGLSINLPNKKIIGSGS